MKISATAARLPNPMSGNIGESRLRRRGGRRTRCSRLAAASIKAIRCCSIGSNQGGSEMTEPDGKWMANAIRRSDRRRLSDVRLNLPELPTCSVGDARKDKPASADDDGQGDSPGVWLLHACIPRRPAKTCRLNFRGSVYAD